MNPANRQRTSSRETAAGRLPGGSRPAGGAAGLDLSRLANVRQRGNRTVAACPACRESGSDKSGDHLIVEPDGRFGCVKHAGPSGSDHRKRIFELAGVGSSSGISRPEKRTAATRPARSWPTAKAAARDCTPSGFTLANLYLYGDAGAVARYESESGKTFRQYHANGNGWEPGAIDGLWPLYQFETLPADGTVYVVEGEKSQAGAASIGLPSTCSAGGSNGADRSDWTPLAGRDCIILPDNDAPGEAYAQAVSGILGALTPPAKCRVLRLPDLPDGGDVADWIDAHGDAAEPDGMRAEIESMAMAAEPAAPGGLQVVNAAGWIATEPPPPNDILDGLFEAGDKVCLIAGSKQRKTFFLTQSALSLATGRRFLAWNVARPYRVMIVQLEVKSLHFHRRLWRMARALGIAAVDLGDRLAIVNGRGAVVSADAITGAAIGHKAEVIILDPLFKLLTGDENLARDMKPLLADFDRIAEKTGAAILYSHHDSKGVSGDRSTRDRGAGSNVLSRDYDTCLTLTEHATEDDSAVVNILARNHPPAEPFTIIWRDGAFFESDAAPDAVTSRTRKPIHGDKIKVLRETEPDLTRREVAKRVGCSLSTVQEWWDR